jgi:triacylglycerol lipase
MTSFPGPIAAARSMTQLLRHVAAAQVQELRTMAVVGAVIPLSRATRDFVQPAGGLRSVAATPAPTARPVMLVHGFGGTTYGWDALAEELRARGVTVEAISYAPFGRSVEQLAERLAEAVARLLAETGADKVHLVGHSLGGIIIAQALADGFLEGQVDTVVTVAAPFGGSPWARLMPIAASVRQLRDGSPLLRRIAVAPLPTGVRWVVVTAALDIVVPGRRSLPRQAAVHSITVEGVGHVGLLVDPRVVSSIAAALPSCEQVDAEQAPVEPAPAEQVAA